MVAACPMKRERHPPALVVARAAIDLPLDQSKATFFANPADRKPSVSPITL
jgi:hypothetical protein